MSDTIRDALMKAWEGRPWKDHAQNPPSMLPQLAIALGLMHPGARNLTMARDLARAGDMPAAFPPGMAVKKMDLGDGIHAGGAGRGQGAVYAGPEGAFFKAEGAKPATLNPYELDEIFANINMRNPRAMRPDLKIVD